jgi:hypothetical protein
MVILNGAIYNIDLVEQIFRLIGYVKFEEALNKYLPSKRNNIQYRR